MAYRGYAMKSKAKIKSDAFEAIPSAAQGLHHAGTIDKAAMRVLGEVESVVGASEHLSCQSF